MVKHGWTRHDENPYVAYRDNLERVVACMEREGVNAAMVYAWAEAKRLAVDAEAFKADDENWTYEDAPDREQYGPWSEWESDLDCLTGSGGEARDYVRDTYEDIAAAMEALYGPYGQ